MYCNRLILSAVESVSVLKMFSNSWKGLRDQWLQERFPESREITLNIRRIFVIPTKVSGGLALALLVLFLIAINFQNSLVYGLAFWLLALVVITIFFTYRNLSGVTLRAIQASPCFAGEKAVFEFEVSCPEKQKKTAISVGWKYQDLATVNLQTHHSVHIKLSHGTQKRGYFKPERLNIFTVYPLGLVVAWSYASFDMASIVYPEPLLQEATDTGLGVDDEAQEGDLVAHGSTDFSGIREYQVGDSPRHIHWGAYAKTGKAYTKTFVDYATQDLWLDWDALNIMGDEAKLSHLCAKVLEYHKNHQVYGLKLPDNTIQPGSGEAHKTICLTALALFGGH